jgi:hypothetical protein
LQPSSGRVFVHPHSLGQCIPPHPSVAFSPCHPSSYSRSYLLHRHCGESAGRRRRIARSHSQYWPQCPVFHLNRCDPAVWNHALRSGVWRPGREQVAQVQYLASQTFTTSYPTPHTPHILKRAWRASFYGLIVFGCLFFTESYIFLTLAFRDPIRAMAGIVKFQNCQ